MTTTRIANLPANTRINSYFLATQARMEETQIQMSTGKVSQDYAGIGTEAERLINTENTSTMLKRYTTQNQLADVKLQVMEETLSGITKTISDFRETLFTFSAGALDDETQVANIQQTAINHLKDLETFLNTDAGGEYIFSGGRVDQRPVDFGLTDVASFQSNYDGLTVVYPITRDAHVDTKLTTASATTGNLTFSTATNTITAANAGTLSSIPVGATITVDGSASNDDRYTVVSNNGTTITITGTIAGTTVSVTNTIAANETVAATLSVDTYYSGDRTEQTHRVSDSRDFSFDINAIDPAFEKAIRAMSIIAQGVFGTAGGLDQNTQRIDESLSLLGLALSPPVGVTAPYGTEQSGDMATLEQDNGDNRLLVQRTIAFQQKLTSFYDKRTTQVEDADPLETVTKLLDDARSLEASFQSLARIRELSLTKFL